ncbi:mechanosensitive ion channel family protein [Pelistega suis]|uniref:mechanosensitive ion channel family protein n=1 Tax=Pelistega suis TaxID=1631957 RepID=UPI00211BB48C|nr:mechanosensitive ion channel family protein [Pelistega suis]MCQ9328113.1 mechanosensitive ion channel family protein [Pelistega suis]
MQQQIQNWLVSNNVAFYPEYLALALALLGILICCVGVSYVAYLVLRRIMQNVCAKSSFLFVRSLSETQLFTHINYLVVAIVLQQLLVLWLQPSTLQKVLLVIAQVWLLLCVLFIAFALLNALTRWTFERGFAGNFPVRGLIQTIKLLLSIGIGIGIISLLIGQSPLILLSGLGAMTAVLMLVFKDPILGLVAGIQLSANNMLSIGDWLEMSKYNADGAVVDIGLTTVKVRNWDNTVTTIPTYALISDSFKNWRPMSESGGRRIKRSVMIDVSTVRFISEDEVNRLTRSPLLSEYIIAKSHELEQANREADMSLGLNGRRLTNLGTFRAYLARYLKNHPHVHQEMTVMVRQLAPTENGVPLEIYCFSNDVAWVNYEGIQADIFDHIFAVVGEFGLRIHQSPTGYDMQIGLHHKD